ncbi:MAG: hypothetical protein V4559_08370 [Pseudomonadota bacterium]
MNEVITLNKAEKTASKTRGYYIVTDQDGNEFRLPEHIFVPVDGAGKDLEPSEFNRYVIDSDLSVPNFRIRTIQSEDDGPAWAVAYVNVMDDGSEFIVNTNHSNFLMDGRWERIGEAAYADPGYEIATFRRKKAVRS